MNTETKNPKVQVDLLSGGYVSGEAVLHDEDGIRLLNGIVFDSESYQVVKAKEGKGTFIPIKNIGWVMED